MAFDRPTRRLRIGEFVLDPELNELRCDDAVQRLPARIADLLLRLALEPGKMLRREQLLDEVWERRQVNDEVLSRAVADLRQALGDDARTPRYIETLPKLGYRLVAAVQMLDPPADRDPPDDATQGVARATPVLSDSLADAPRTVARRIRMGAMLLASLLVVSAAAWLGLRADGGSPMDPLSTTNLLRARPFTAAAGREMFPRFTPDANWVIYTSVADDAARAVVRLRAVDGTEDRALVEDEFDNYCGSVSPDGHQLAWARRRVGVCELAVRPLLGGPVRVLGACGDTVVVGCPDWSPDGRRLLLGAGRGGDGGLREIDIELGVERALTRLPSQGGSARDLMPRYSPDHSDIVFWRGDGWGRALMRLDLARGEVTPLHDEAYLGFGHAFATDGTLLIADDSFGRRALVRRDRDGGSSLLGAWDARYPDLAADGSIVFEVTRYDANLWRIDLRDTSRDPQQITTSERYDSHPACSPDGEWIAFGSNRDGREGVYLVRADGAGERKLPLDSALRWTAPAWSPDGRDLLLSRYDAGGARLCLHTLASGATRCPSHWPTGAHAGFFLSRDEVGFLMPSGEGGPLWRAALLDDSPARIEPGPVMERCRAAGHWLACARAGQRGLQLRDARSGRVQELLPELGPENRGEWNLHPHAIYFAARNDDPAQSGIHRLDLSSGERRRVSAMLPSAIGEVLDVAPDETWLVLARTDRVDSDLMIVPSPRAQPQP